MLQVVSAAQASFAFSASGEECSTTVYLLEARPHGELLALPQVRYYME
jgi:hypothetical protein